MPKRLAIALVVLAFVLGVLLTEWSQTMSGARFGCTYGPLPFGLSNWSWLETRAEEYCGS